MGNIFRDAFRNLKTKLFAQRHQQQDHMAAAPPPEAVEPRKDRRRREKVLKQSLLNKISRAVRNATRAQRATFQYRRPADSHEARARATALTMQAANRAVNATHPARRLPTSMSTLRPLARRRIANELQHIGV